jgi:type IV pilus assembly protein PilM
MIQFLTLHPKSFGLDVSEHSIKIASLKKRGRRYALASYNNSPLQKGIIENGEVKKEKELAAAIRKAVVNVKGDKLSGSHVVASLPEEKAFLQVMQIPKMTLEEVKEAVQFEAENYIPLPIDTVYLDFAVIPPIHDQLDHLDVLLASLPRISVDSYVSAIRNAGLDPVIMEIESIATSRAVIKNGLSPVPVLIADIGAAKTRLSVYSGYSLRYTSSIPMPAELLLKGDTADETRIPVYTDFKEQINKYIGFFESHSGHQHLKEKTDSIAKIYLTGGGANAQGLPEFLSRELRIESLLADPWINITPQPFEELPPISMQDSLSYSTALGLALRGTMAHD